MESPAPSPPPPNPNPGALRSLLERLGLRTPADRLLTGKAELAPYESDGLTAFREAPGAVLLAEEADEVIFAVQLCRELSVPFVARGSGTSLSGGSLPIRGGLVIALNRMNRVLSYRPQSRTIVVEPGVVNLQVSKHAAGDGLYYAPDPSSGPVCTIGGNVAFNSGGAHCLKYGMTANHVLGIKAVLPDGEVVQLGGASHESVGADLAGMFVGSEGLFGIALEITLRLLPIPERFHTVLAAYDSLSKAGDAVARVVASGMLPGAMEIMDKLAIEAAEQAVHAGYPTDAAAALIVELEGPAEEVADEIPRLDEIIEASGAFEVRVAKSTADRMTIWKGRKGAFSAVGRLSPDYIVQDGVVPRSRLGEALAEVERLGIEYGLRVANVFHAGDGNLHPLILFDGRIEGQLHQAEALAGEILKMCIRLGGSITGEHGVGVEKLAYLPAMYGETEMKLMADVRRAVDPLELANRGKMLLVEADSKTPNHAPHPLESAGVISRG
ncbi:FAD-linked oxidase C-terminal domain-containing protein [Pirellulales bacterium]|nr:FAD-linked oxidase C-terminal domain-containing protein [Pirellulales bacterium]